MDSLRERFEALDRVPVPDLWAEVERRASAGVPRAAELSAVRTRRLMPEARSSANVSWLGWLAAAALLAALVVGAVAVGSAVLRRSSEPSIAPEVSPPAVSPVVSPIASGSPTLKPTPSGAAATWTTAGAMMHVGGGHTATLLDDGRVLVVGRSGENGPPDAAEVFDPARGSWTSTGAMLGAPERGQTATRLLDGRVLVTGGQIAPTVASAELAQLFDPATGTWSSAGRMTAPRLEHTATLLGDGRVLVAGGSFTALGTTYSSAELYDPATGRWTRTGAMAHARSGHTATLLADGTVLVAGGYPGGSETLPLASAERYDPATGRWSPAGTMATRLAGQTAVALPDGTVLVLCGTTSPEGTFSAVVQRFDPSDNSWTLAEPLPSPRYGCAATVLSSGRVLVTGGLPTAHAKDVLASAELYDPATDTWTPTADLNVARSGHTATLLQDGSVLVTGGLGAAPQGYALGLRSVEIYHPGS